jgi:hypothetical protein
MSQEIVTINGTPYDKHTGMPLHNAKKQSSTSAHSSERASRVHARRQKSTTLDRRYLKNPHTAQGTPKIESASPLKATVNTHDSAVAVSVTRSPQPRPAAPTLSTPKASHPAITKFAKPPTTPSTSPAVQKIIDIGPTVHPMVQRVQAATPKKQHTVPKPSAIIKAEAIEKALAHTPTSTRVRNKMPKSARHARRAHFTRVAAACIALLLIGGYFTYVNMPNVSVRVAAIQAGIDASYPSYRPTGYSLSGPVAYNDGEVIMKFAANGSSQSYSVSQTKSGLDSSAVLERYIKPLAGEDYTVTRDSGLTIYTYHGNAAWVNNGILYTLSGDAPLTDDQVERIALSM